MKLRRFFLTGALLSATVLSTLLSGCSMNFTSENLLHPPKTTGREAEIQKLIDVTAGGRYMLKYPKSGLYRSAIVTEDINKDKKDEAIAFYRTTGDNAKTHMLIMSDTKDGWKLSCNYECDYADIDCVQFADYDYDGVPEVFVGFVPGLSTVNELNIFDYNSSKKSFERVEFTKKYNTFTTGDYDQDGASEILTMTLSTTDTNAEAVLTDYDKNVLYTLDSCAMDPAVTRFDGVTSGLVGGKTTGVAVDGLLESTYNTQVIYYNPDKRELVNFPYSSKKKLNPTVRSYSISCNDIDDDGFVEIPVVNAQNVKLDGSEETVAPVITWNSLNTRTNKLKSDLNCVTNFDFGYYLVYPENFTGTTVATISGDNRTMKIYALNGTAKGGLVLTIKAFDVGTDDMNGFSTLESANQYTFAYKIEENAPIYIDEQTLKENFGLNDSNA